MKALVTRPREDAASLLRALAERGIEALPAPMLTIVPAPDAARRLRDVLASAQAVMFTSVNGVRAFAATSPRRELPAFAVGHATAAAARIAGFRAVADAGGDVEDLAELVATRLSPKGGAIVHAAGSRVAGDLAQTLGASGFAVQRVSLYDAVPAVALEPETAAALARGEAAFAFFFSPLTARTFVRVAAAAGVGPSCQGMTALALSPAVAMALEALAWSAIRVAAAPSQQALLSAFDGYLAESPAGRSVGGA